MASMPTSDPTAVMLAHGRWATERLLDACAPLDEESFHQRFEVGPGSLHDTISHQLAAMRAWGDLLAGRPQQDRLDDGRRRTVDELRVLLDELSSDLEASARSGSPADLVTGERGGRSFTFTRGAVVTHVLTHGMHHRAQCLNMLRRLGVDPLPPSAVVEWMIQVDGAA